LKDYFDKGFLCGTENHDHTPHPPLDSRDDVLIAHCFQPLAKWISEELEPAHWLLFAETSIGASAMLQKKNDPVPPSGEEGEEMYKRIRIWARHR
jgi:hypothetical protein